MQYTKAGKEYVIILNKGEKVVSSLTDFCSKHDIRNGYFRGIGAVAALECGYYALDEKEYHFTTYDTMLEVASLTGNVMMKEGAPFIHVHGVFTDTANNALGGHIKEMTVGVTLEIVLTPLSSSLDRQLDQDIGLFLINCPG